MNTNIYNITDLYELHVGLNTINIVYISYINGHYI